MNNASLRSLTLLAFPAAAAVFALTACTPSPAPDRIAQGRHIVESVGMCVDCHSPRLPDGQLDPAHPLAGSPLAFKPTVPMPWADVAPAIAGLPTYPDDEAAVKFLMTGATNRGTVARPPMPTFRLTREEAEAVVAYLRSLKPEKS